MIYSKALKCSELRADALKTEGAELCNTRGAYDPAVTFFSGRTRSLWMVLQPYAASFQQNVVVSFRQNCVENKDLKLEKTPEKGHWAAS